MSKGLIAGSIVIAALLACGLCYDFGRAQALLDLEKASIRPWPCAEAVKL